MNENWALYASCNHSGKLLRKDMSLLNMGITSVDEVKSGTRHAAIFKWVAGGLDSNATFPTWYYVVEHIFQDGSVKVIPHLMKKADMKMKENIIINESGGQIIDKYMQDLERDMDLSLPSRRKEAVDYFLSKSTRFGTRKSWDKFFIKMMESCSCCEQQREEVYEEAQHTGTTITPVITGTTPVVAAPALLLAGGGMPLRRPPPPPVGKAPVATAAAATATAAGMPQSPIGKAPVATSSSQQPQLLQVVRSPPPAPPALSVNEVVNDFADSSAVIELDQQGWIKMEGTAVDFVGETYNDVVHKSFKKDQQPRVLFNNGLLSGEDPNNAFPKNDGLRMTWELGSDEQLRIANFIHNDIFDG